MLHVAKAFGFADIGILSSDTIAQALPIGYPNEPGILRGLPQRRDRRTEKAITTLGAMFRVAKALIPQIVQWITTGVVAKGKRRCRAGWCAAQRQAAFAESKLAAQEDTQYAQSSFATRFILGIL